MEKEDIISVQRAQEDVETSYNLLNNNNNNYYYYYCYRTLILPVVLYGKEPWSRRLRVFENRVLRGIFGPKRDEVTREWRKLHNEEINDVYSSPYMFRVIKSRRMR